MRLLYTVQVMGRLARWRKDASRPVALRPQLLLTTPERIMKRLKTLRPELFTPRPNPKPIAAKKTTPQQASHNQLKNVLLLSNFVSITLFGLRVIATNTSQYWFLFWNLLLAWVPVLCAWWLLRELQRSSWKKPIPIILTLLWLGFLPNSFYLMSDLIHLHSTGDIGILYDSVLFLSCIWNGVLAGMLSLVWVHRAILQRRSSLFAAGCITGVFAVVSYAIYLGRALHWNTWDVLINPAGLIFDVSEQVIKPLDHPQVVVTTFTFFALLGSMYLVIWQLVNVLQKTNQK